MLSYEIFWIDKVISVSPYIEKSFAINWLQLSTFQPSIGKINLWGLLKDFFLFTVNGGGTLSGSAIEGLLYYTGNEFR